MMRFLILFPFKIFFIFFSEILFYFGEMRWFRVEGLVERDRGMNGIKINDGKDT